jgi:phosphoglycolate phosphatase
MRKLVLFDIDGTLILTGGAGMRAMIAAGESVFDAPEMFAGVEMAGRTDWSILHDGLARIGAKLDETWLVQFKDAYTSHLRREILEVGSGRKGVMPGIDVLLRSLRARRDVFLGLLTGNFEDGARIKLEHFDLWRHFRCGAFGDDAADRNDLVPFALERARACGLDGIKYADVVVVGDTPHDVSCARVVGATSIAVATGSYDVDQLRASGASVVLHDLSDTNGFLALLDALP